MANKFTPQAERLDFLLRTLLKERPSDRTTLPDAYAERRSLLRALVNVRPPVPVSEAFLSVQDAFLRQETLEKDVVSVTSFPRSKADSRVALWQGDITRVAADAIVNAANEQMLGCFVPGHRCIDNAIHSAAGVQLREQCHQLMAKQGHAEPTGKAKITSGYNLPAKHVIHTVGPIVQGPLRQKDRALLKGAYTSCLCLAEEAGLSSIAFCCISTGLFGFPKREACQIALQTVQEHLKSSALAQVAFVVFTDEDYALYDAALHTSSAQPT